MRGLRNTRKWRRRMTESEAISWLKTLKRMYRAYPSEVIKAWDMAIEALKEVQKYRAIGTVEECQSCMDILNKEEAVFELAKIADEWISYHKIGTIEECREARERRNGKKPYIFFDFYNSEKNGCPNYHENNERNEILYAGQKYCSVCGQAIDWAE